MSRRAGRMARLLLTLTVSCVALGLAGSPASARGKKDKDKDKESYSFAPAPTMAPRPRMMMRAMGAPSGRMGVTQGGAQDVAFARQEILAGRVPHPKTFTSEGLLSRYDLPLAGSRGCKQTICLETAATKADLAAQPEVRWIAQLGFSSNINPKTWKRDPINLIAVVDKSGSMSGSPLDTVKKSLKTIVGQLKSNDQIGIVLYGSTTHVHMQPTSIAKAASIYPVISSIVSEGSTAMEQGLALGFKLARKSQKSFKGRTRVMLFTDERPNVGATSAGSFMTMSRAASKQRIGLTTIGVGTQFGAELATKIASVRGGNLFFFSNVAEMRKRFAKDLDVMITELGYDMKLNVQPSAGYKLVGLYGVPGDAVKRTKNGGLTMTVETLFLSKERGGIFFGFAPNNANALPPAAGPLASATISYQALSGAKHNDKLAFKLATKSGSAHPAVPLGLARGIMLIDEITTLKKATGLHLQKNDQAKAYKLVRLLKARFDQSKLTGLDKERKLINKLHGTLQHLSGHKGEAPKSNQRHAVSGLPF